MDFLALSFRIALGSLRDGRLLPVRRGRLGNFHFQKRKRY